MRRHCRRGVGSFSRILPLVTVGLSLLLASCLEQFDPSRYLKKAHDEWHQSVQPVAKLSATGEIPAAGANTVSPDERFQTLCSSCHGPKGNGDGPGGAALAVKPRNFHDKSWQAKVDDARIAAVITNGGASVGLSAVMAPWGSVLSPEEVQGLVKKIRAFGKE